MHSRFFRRSGAALSLLALCGGLTGAALAATAGSASAQQNSDIIPFPRGCASTCPVQPPGPERR
jgi:hypothetical protein